MTDLLLRNARPWTPGAPLETTDLAVTDGRFTTPGDEAAQVIDLDGAIVLPGFVDAHCHLDKTMFGGPWTPNTGGRTLEGRIRNGEGRRAELGLPNPDYAANLLSVMASHGTTHVRSHIDIDPEVGLAGVEAVREAAARLAGKVDVELVAFPQGGLLTRPGVAELLDAALKGGVEVIGGLDPAGFDRDPAGQLDLVFDLAERHGAKIDVHLHDQGLLGAWEYELIIERTRLRGLAGRVTISHAYAMGGLEPDHQRRIAEALAEAGVAMITCAVGGAPVIPVRLMDEAGAELGIGNDGIRDLWTPYGDGDLLRKINQVAFRDRLVADSEIELALAAGTHGGARILGLEDYGLGIGCKADLVAVDAAAPAEAVVSVPQRKLVVKGGKVVAHNATPAT
ncbi:amidohydrolase [Glycomyces algeriensis]|uniref:Cytosine deaminase n=1 Tax=Glycomyces algeriensis TaxID=256037 RepID=A0A9W6LEW9_9ACTN|nr:amidohydrolase [Glycomyces algeriensis]MDA1368925.1 amidohydrolase [Glycomyces algeriensis]MDR7352801.1 cytosine deaminase [Glycomyces algeriensis]GLI40485.1 cytosine deaminase [Glycomyces algeriensis]